MHPADLASFLLAFASALLGAKLLGEICERLGQPAVLGELLAGVLLGPSMLGLVPLSAGILLIAEVGVLLLLFEVGLESTVGQMLKVGLSSFAVAAIGVAVPFALGWGVGAWLLPDSSTYVHAFLGATLSATSVGITARVLKDIDRIGTPEARIILGAAVIDDVFGLVILAVVTGIIAAADRGGSVSFGEVSIVLFKATAFLVGSLAIGIKITPRLFHLASKLRSREVLLAVGLSFCFVLAWVAERIGLAPIVGAFAAGLILEDLHYKSFVDRGEHGLEELVRPISSFLVPIFFVVMGMRTDLRSFAQPGVLGVAAALTLAAVLGKQACGLGVLTRGVNRAAVGIGMIPRGEVGLIFANIGLTLTIGGKPIVDRATFSAVVVMVIVTTLITPPLLKWSLGRGGKGTLGSGPAGSDGVEAAAKGTSAGT